jgi:hypothetical protein
MTNLAAASPQDLETLRRLLDAIGGVPFGITKAGQAAALTELTGLVWRPGLNVAALDMLISGLLFSVRSMQDSNLIPQVIQQVKAAKNPASLEDIDAAAFFPQRARRVLKKLDNIPEDLLFPLLKAAPEVLAGLSLEELIIVLLSGETPGWLCKTILVDKRLLNILDQTVYVPYGLLTDVTNGLSDEQKTAELNRTLEQTRKVLEWVNKCPAEYLPVSIDPCPQDEQEYAVCWLGRELRKFPPDKLLTLISLDTLPAWFRKAAEKCFQELTKSAAANSPERPKRHRRRRSADTQPPEETNGAAV